MERLSKMQEKLLIESNENILHYDLKKDYSGEIVVDGLDVTYPTKDLLKHLESLGFIELIWGEIVSIYPTQKGLVYLEDLKKINESNIRFWITWGITTIVAISSVLVALLT